MDEEPRLLRLVEFIYDAATEPDRWRRCLAALGREFDAHVAAILLHEPPVGCPEATASIGMAAELIEEYRERHHRDDVWLRCVRALPSGAVVRSEELLPYEELRRSAFFERFLARADVHHMLCATLAGRGHDERCFVTLERSDRTGPFDDRSRDLLGALVPHLQRAMLIDRRLRDAAAGERSGYAAIDRLGDGVALLAPSGRCVHLNPAAERLVRSGGALAVRGGRLRARPAALDARLRHLVDRSLAGRAGALSIPRGPRQVGLQVVVAPLAEEETGGPRRQARVLVFLAAPDGDSLPSERRLGRCFGLTPAEARLTRRLVEGQTLPSAAAALGISTNTARTHLKRAFEKTGARRQAELVSLVLRSLPRTNDDPNGE